jgi:AcrR family transcriptional regulator
MPRIVRSTPAKLQHVLVRATVRIVGVPAAGTSSAKAGAGRSGTRAAETAARKRRLLDAAVELAAEGGYDAVQMRDVAARAEVALGTLYRHYASKDQLLLAALADQATTLRERLDQRPPRGDAPAERVADVLRRATRALERQPRVTHAMVTAMSVSDDSAAPVKQEINETLRAIIVDAVDGAPVADLDDVVRVLGSVWFAELTFWSGGLTDATAMADHLARAAALLLGAV